MKIDESNYELIERASKVTFTDYGIKWFDAENVDGYLETYSIESIIENLLDEIDRRDERIEELENKNDYPSEEMYREREILGI